MKNSGVASRAAKMTVVREKLKLPDEEKFYAYLGALFSRIGLLAYLSR